VTVERVSVWDVLAEPFPPEAVKERQGPKQHEGACEKRYGQCQKPHKMLSYVDARDVEARLDDAVTPAGWDFMATIAQGNVVHGTLVLFVGDRAVTRQDYGYPNGDDDAEPLKSAVSDAIKRCAVQFGVGRHLYTDNKVTRRPAQPAQNAPQRPAAPRPVSQSAPQRSEPPRAATAPVQNVQPMTVKEAMTAVEGFDRRMVSDTAKALVGTWSFRDMTAEQRAQVVAAITGGGSAVPAEPSPVPPSDDEDWGRIFDKAPAA
jgi:hypothetical protein